VLVGVPVVVPVPVPVPVPGGVVPVGVVGVMVEGGDMPVGVLVDGVVVVPPPALLHFEAKYNQHMI
jgi:hypothetical protein